MKKQTQRAPRSGRRGAAIVTTLVVVGVMGTLSLAVLSGVNSAFRLNKTVQDEAGSHFVAEAGLAEALDRMRKGGDGEVGANGALVAYGGGRYWVESEALGEGVVELTSTAVRGRAATRLELVIDTTNATFFQWGAFGDDGLTMDSNAQVDSYDSSEGPYSADNGSGNNKYSKANGAVGSNKDIEMDSNTMIHGNAVPGIGGVVIESGKATVTGTTTPNTEVVELPPIDVPVIASSGDWSPSGTVSLAAGDHAFDAFNLDSNSTLTISGPARIVCEDMYVDSNSSIVIDASGGEVEFWIRGDFVMNSNTLIAASSKVPSTVNFNLLTDNVVDPDVDVDLDLVDFDSNAKLYGTVYAPNAHVEINSNFELFGSLIAFSVDLDSNSYIHFDEALLESEEEAEESGFTRIAWRERPVRLSEIKE